ncbi:Sporulation domain protein [Lysobacter dokdonensis DS-58]|uniref:Sporulation domain protein n=1 Tax=Lysobacter dokdonensis DS-58 TaxID=1300345 RepID=A0A0A2WDP7_9GAMM|nr:SPOR domain-containing protein [Lysobacter dokdonensis]KGQ17858.1 Sporulation domain protein [Lysobacter dokdonensis DS-58]
MMQRALIVFLVVINVGVAAWWASRSPRNQGAPIEAPAGVPRLQLLAEAPQRARPQTPAPSTSLATAAIPADARCVSFGPFDNPALLRRAHERLQPQVLRANVRNVVVGAPRGWRVIAPPLATQEAAQALADRMTAAGLDDLIVMPTGVDRNGIALGRFGSEESARRRLAQVQAAGFDQAKVEPVGDVRTQGWIDVAATNAFDAALAARDSAAPRTEPLDCANLR